MNSKMANIEETGSCPVCLESYMDRDPKMLGCGHSMCKVCSDKLIGDRRRNHLSSQADIICPMCRVTTRVPTGGLPVNYSLKELLHSLALAPKKEWRQCAACQDQHTPDNFWFCEECAEKTPSSSTAEQPRPTFSCSRCCLKYHNGHRLLGLNELSSRRDAVARRMSELTIHFAARHVASVSSADRLRANFATVGETIKEALSKSDEDLKRRLSSSSFSVSDIGSSNQSVDETRRRLELAYAHLLDVNVSCERSLEMAYNSILHALASSGMETTGEAQSSDEVSGKGSAPKRALVENSHPLLQQDGVYVFSAAPQVTAGLPQSSIRKLQKKVAATKTLPK